MALRQWKLQDAKNHFSAVVDIAMKESPQVVTRLRWFTCKAYQSLG